MRATLVPAVHVFLVRDTRGLRGMREREILLSRRAATGYEDGRLGVVAGHLERGETVTACAVREAREEVGVEIAEEDVRVVGLMHRSPDRIDFFVTVERWSGAIVNAEPDKCSELVWARADALPDDVIAYVRRALEASRDAAGAWFLTHGLG